MSTNDSSHNHETSPTLTCSDTDESTTLNCSDTTSNSDTATMDDANPSNAANGSVGDGATLPMQSHDHTEVTEEKKISDAQPDNADIKIGEAKDTSAETDTIRDSAGSPPRDATPQQTSRNEISAEGEETQTASKYNETRVDNDETEVSEFPDHNNIRNQNKVPISLSTAHSVASNGTHDFQPRRSPSVMSFEASKPDPPPSVVDYDEEREELDNEDDLPTSSTDTRPRDEFMTVDENRIEGRILHAALVGNAPASRASMISAATEPDGLRSSALSMDLPPDLQQQNQTDQQTYGSNSSFTLERETVPSVLTTPDHTHTIATMNHSADEPIASDVVNRVHSSPSLTRLASRGRTSTEDSAVSLTQSVSAVNIVHPTFMAPTAPPQPFLSQPPAGGVVRESSFSGAPIMMAATSTPLSGGRRKIRLRMEEEPSVDGSSRIQEEDDESYQPGLLKSIRRRSNFMFGSGGSTSNAEFLTPISESNRGVTVPKPIDRGMITLCWFEGTSFLELQEHVRKSVARKLKLPSHIQLVDVRVLDESVDPPEEIVLSPFIPDGSEFLLRFSTQDINKDGDVSPNRPPDSPSAAPSPHPEVGKNNGLSTKQLAHLTKKLDSLRPSNGKGDSIKKEKNNQRGKGRSPESGSSKSGKTKAGHTNGGDGEVSDDDEMVLHSEDPIETRLRQITELLLMDRERQHQQQKEDQPRHDRRQVIFTLANYFVLFLSLIAISAEIQARAPEWLASLEGEMKNVQNCAADQDALFECVSRGDFAGLVASLMLWLSRSVATRRVFLFGFETPKKLWTVVYESFVTAICWGFSYLFIRRGMNPDTSRRFLHKYWKDALFGSLAGFNAAFMKQVLKNLIPQEAVEDALRERQLKILSWLPNFGD